MHTQWFIVLVMHSIIMIFDLMPGAILFTSVYEKFTGVYETFTSVYGK